jgi:hypothetical protein
VPLALLIMPFTRSSSIPIQPWLLARSVVSLWVKSSRLRACRALSAAICARVRRSLGEYRPRLCRLAQRSWRALRRSSPTSRRCSPAVSVSGSSRGEVSSETQAEHATPKSSPHPGRPLGATGAVSAAIPNETCQPSPSRRIVALRTTPPRGRDSRKRTPPIFGSRTSAPLRLRLRTAMAWPGNGTSSPLLRFLNVGGPAGCCGFHQLS